MTTPSPAPTGATSAAADTGAPRGAAGPSYAGEWGLFCDYATATGQPTLPTTVATLTGFLTALPARPATLARRVRAIAAAHRRAGHLLDRPDIGPAAPSPSVARRPRWTDPGAMLAACPTRGWPCGLHGRRDAFLIVTALVLDLPQARVRGLLPAEVAVGADGALVCEQAVPSDADPRRCPRCAVVRWLEILGVLDGLGRGSARMDLTTAHAPTATDPHRHDLRGPRRWRAAATLLPALDRHGWHDDYRPITTRTIRTRLALAGTRAASQQDEQITPVPRTLALGAAAPTTAGRESPSLDEAIALLEDIAADADALNDRILALLEVK